MSRGRVVTAFSGGIESCWTALALSRRLGYDVITVTVDTGGFEGRDLLRLKARSLTELHMAGHETVSVKEEACRHILSHQVRANLVSPTGLPEMLAAARLLQAREVARAAARLRADAIAYGASGNGQDALAFESGWRIFAPGWEVLDPSGGEVVSREEKVRYVVECGVPVEVRAESLSEDRYLWATFIEYKSPREAWDAPLLDLLPDGETRAETKPREMLLGFEGGLPVSIGGRRMEPVALAEQLAQAGAAFRVGRGVSHEVLGAGLRRRVAFDAPLHAILAPAHRELEAMVLTPDQLDLGAALARRYREMLYGGRYYDPAARDIEGFFQSHQSRVTGEVRLRLLPGRVEVLAAHSPHALTDEAALPVAGGPGLWSPRDIAGYAHVAATTSALAARLFADAAAGAPGLGSAPPAAAVTPKNAPTAATAPGKR
ncbi:MAG: argininosuccinate synthase [Planctomycetes bacterium]|nr:argininosuccinate synthase [Planctomycetota bacterium]